MSYVIVKRIKDGVLLDIPESDLDDTLAQGFEFVDKIGDLYANSDKKAPKPIKLECPLCGYMAKTEEYLQKHKKTHYD